MESMPNRSVSARSMSTVPSLASSILRAVLAAAPLLPVSAAVYEVGPSRADKQLTAVASRLNPGDTVKVDGGSTYGAVTLTRSGTRERPIVIQGLFGADGARALLSGGTNTLHLRAGWHVVEGLEITGGSSRCVFHEGADNLLRNVVVRDCPKQGILGADQGSGNFTLELSEVYRCGGGDRDHQIYMTTDQVAHPGSVFRLQHCYIHDANGGNNVKSRSERNEIRYNWIEGGYYHELELIGPDPGGVSDGWTPRLEREDSDVVGNVFRKRRTAAGNDSNFAVFRVGGDGTGESHGRYRFVNNTVIAGTGAVFRCFDSLESVELHNNVFHRPGGGLNLSRVVEADWTAGQPTFAGSNNWITTGATNVPAGLAGTLTGTDPGFLDFARRDLRPAAASPLRNAANPSPLGSLPFPDPHFPPAFGPPTGVHGAAPLPRPQAGALDIGAYEEGSGMAAGGTRGNRRVTGPGIAIRPGAFPAVRRTGPEGSGLRTLLGRETD